MPKKPQYLNEAFLPNLEKAPMPLQSIANRDFARAYRRAISEVAHSDEEVEAYELLFRAVERLRSIYEMRE